MSYIIVMLWVTLSLLRKPLYRIRIVGGEQSQTYAMSVLVEYGGLPGGHMSPRTGVSQWICWEVCLK